MANQGKIIVEYVLEHMAKIACVTPAVIAAAVISDPKGATGVRFVAYVALGMEFFEEINKKG